MIGKINLLNNKNIPNINPLRNTNSKTLIDCLRYSDNDIINNFLINEHIDTKSPHK